MKALTRIVATCTIALLSFGAKAGLNVPYAPDANTLHLWHFDDSTNYVAGINTETDAVANAGITLTNIGLGGPPYTNIFLVTNDANAVLNDSLSILPNDGGSVLGSSHAMAEGPSDMSPTNFYNSTSGAFTFEAIVNPRGNIFSSSAGLGEWEIFCGDNSAGTRGWQFRLQNAPAPVMDFNFITASSGTAVNVSTTLPTSGPDALATNQWYHVAVTYTGNSPTNGDSAGIMTFYWTLLDTNRTSADVLYVSNISTQLPVIGGTPSPAVGGSQRTTHGVGNAGSFQGFIDEVRVSAISRQPTDMVFAAAAVLNPPTFSGGSEPPASTMVGYSKPLSINAVVLGSLPIYYQWQATNSSIGSWTNILNQTNNDYIVSATTFADAGFYRLIATNAALTANSVTSTVAQVIIGAAPSELFNTGINTNGVLDTTLAGSPDPHYTILQSSDVNFLGPNAIVWDMTQYPIAAERGGFANIDGASQWIGTENDSYTSAIGQYVYRTYFLLDTVDTSQPITIFGTWWDGSVGNDILINGQPTGNPGAVNSGTGSAVFTITNGFKPGLNTLDFVTFQDGTNGSGSYQESAVRVEIQGLGQALAPGLPTITTPPANQSVEDANVALGSVATFSVVALGRPPLSYQWYADSNLISGATSRTLVFDNPSSSAPPGTNFQVVVSNSSGSVTSSVAVLTLLGTNQPPVVQNYSLVLYSNTTVNFNFDTAFAAATDPDHDPLSPGVPAYDVTSTNGASISQNGVILTYTPNADYLGADEFNYYISDSQGGTSTGAVSISVLPLIAPTNVHAQLSGGKLVLTGVGPGAGASFHLFSSTNLTVPLSNWTAAGSGIFDNSGNVTVTNPVSPGVPQQFYIFAVP